MKRLSVVDTAFMAIETAETPMHVAVLQVFRLPKGAPATFLADMIETMRGAGEIVRPWCYKLRFGSVVGRIVNPFWVKDKNIDLDYHVRHSALPKPGGEKELGILVSRLHSNSLDFKRPLWECHVIEGLKGRRFAIYSKIHHSLIDGTSGIRLLHRTLSSDPEQLNMPAPWYIPPQSKKRRKEENVPSLKGIIKKALSVVKTQAVNTPLLAEAVGKLIYSGTQKDSALKAPFVGPNSALNKRITAQRRLSTQKLPLKDIKELSKLLDCTVNDIVLYLSGTALRRFLLETNSLPDKALTAGIPVNVRSADDNRTGTSVSLIIASLGTNVEDPMKRLQTILKSTKKAKEHLQSLPKAVLNQYSVLIMAPFLSQQVSRVGGLIHPPFNLVISNVPGPAEPLYFNGAQQEAMYPVSLINHGTALNITCLGYNGELNFGFLGCRDTLPHMQHLAVYSGEAMKELKGLVKKPKPRVKKKKPA